MVQNLSIHSKKVAALLFWILYGSLIGEAWAGVRSEPATFIKSSSGFRNSKADSIAKKGLVITPEKVGEYPKIDVAPEAENKVYIGGPSQPEMSSFKSVGVDNMVNTFTGDFSYNIPLLDVGGYPVNIYYTAGIDPEQEASWVGLGWNINPGNINRSMRGVPDDFDGSETLIQEQNIKINKTWGATLGGDFEFLGTKTFFAEAIQKLIPHFTIGVTVNNKLGPSVEFGANWNFNISKNLTRFASSGHSTDEGDKSSLSASLNLNTSSRSGASLGLSSSLNFASAKGDNVASRGVGLSTGYNSRTGMKAITISEQAKFNRDQVTQKIGENITAISAPNPMSSVTISFLKPSYSPALRPVLTNKSWSGRFEIGVGFGGLDRTALSTEVFGQTSTIESEDIVQKKPLVGFIYSEKAVGNPNVVMDFNRLNDKEVTPNTAIISAPQYSYDVFSVQGEGTGGSFRAYRNDFGYMRDKKTQSKDKDISAGLDIGPWSHFGGNVNVSVTPTVFGDWEKENNLRTRFNFLNSDTTFERVYFRNPGESSFLDSERVEKLGGVDLVRFHIGGFGSKPVLTSTLKRYDKFNNYIGSTSISSSRLSNARNKRSQVISFLTAKEASEIGMDTAIRSYSQKQRLSTVDNTLIFKSFSRVDDSHKSNHISQINITESDGKRYIYGIPVYNITQKDFTFSVANTYSSIPSRVGIDTTWMKTNSPLLNENSSRDGTVNITTTPAYAHSFLLTGLVSSDYVDVTNNGITEDDLGTAVRFNYSKVLDSNDNPVLRKWRTPLSQGDSANFMSGSKTEVKDDQAFVSYGTRESWYLHSIESKSMIAFFYISNRDDAKGPINEYGKVNSNDSTAKKLDSIALFNKADLKKNGLAGARPIKTVHFRYSYKLVNNSPDHPIATNGLKGKLTLDSLYFTYNGVRKAFINKYGFKYTYTDIETASNPDYRVGATDRWGAFKNPAINPGMLTNADFPYVPQERTKKDSLDIYAGAWSLKRIRIPSGGEISIRYESDDYGYVQNKRAQFFATIAGFGYNTNTYNTSLYEQNWAPEKEYVFIKIPEPVYSVSELYNKYLAGVDQLAFRISVNMPKGTEIIPCYATFSQGQYGIVSGKNQLIWIKLDKVGGYNPISLQIMEHLMENLPGQAYKGYDVSNTSGIRQIGEMLGAAVVNLVNIANKPYTVFRNEGKAKYTDTSASFVRLNVPSGIKFGGGHRVKSVVISDRWDSLTNQFMSVYGQNYTYQTEEKIDTGVVKISSGVSSYEPSIGNDENPFQKMLKVENKVPLGPTNFDAIEMPILDALYQSPVVGYSKVTVSSLKKTFSGKGKSRSGTGKQVTEFYTAKDFPTITQHTNLTPDAIVEDHDRTKFASFLFTMNFDYKALTQGFLITMNDMHGKMKSQSAYAENDTLTRITYTQNFYTNTGKNGLYDKLNFVLPDSSGKVVQGNMGVDVELMTDAREFKVKNKSVETQAQVDFLAAVWPTITVWPTIGISESIYRAVTTTKVVNYHSILDSIIVEDKGSVISTKNLAYDFYTGDVIVSRTNNEFKKPIYNTSYPAYWAYSGMGLAYKNIDVVYRNVNFQDGKIISGGVNLNNIESGDEIYIMSVGDQNPDGCYTYLATPISTKMIWAVDKTKNSTSLNNPSRELYFIDEFGKLINLYQATIRIVRSGKRNLLGDKVASVVSAVNPIESNKLLLNNNSKVISTSAIEYKEKWLSEADVFPKVITYFDTTQCKLIYVEDENGALEKSINPYLKGILGNFKQFRSLVFYNNRKEKDTISQTNISTYGYLDSFSLYWNFNAMNNLVPDTATTSSWVWNSKITHINSKNLEVETLDPLGIYTGAQYGYNKTLPVAIANNSRYNEFFVDGFEDYQYSESINKTSFNKTVRHIDFSKATNATIVNTDALGFRAHTGKYALAVSGTSVLNLPVSASYDDYSLINSSLPLLSVVKGPLGGRISDTLVIDGPSKTQPLPLFSDPATYNNGSSTGGVDYYVRPFIQLTQATQFGYSAVNYGYQLTAKHYFEIKKQGVYVFNFRSFNTYTPLLTPGENAAFPKITSIEVKDTVNNVTYTGTQISTYTGSVDFIKTRQFCLRPGIYIMVLKFAADRGYNCFTGGCDILGYKDFLMMDKYSIYDNQMPSSNSIQFFRTYSTVVNCNYTTPFPATVNMFKSSFIPVANKKMVLSAWVRENCGDISNNVPCKVSSYTNNQIQMKFTGGVTTILNFQPTGPIIDGWQRYEAVFTVPNATTNLELSLMNTGAGVIYFDDIRIHPYNSNVKGYVYDPVNLRLTSELDANNYASFYEYDLEGTLIRTKIETKEGIKTVTETRSALQKILK